MRKVELLPTRDCEAGYGAALRVTKLKVAPNMADPISLNEENLP